MVNSYMMIPGLMDCNMTFTQIVGDQANLKPSESQEDSDVADQSDPKQGMNGMTKKRYWVQQNG